MFIAYAVLAVVLALALSMSAFLTFTRNEKLVDGFIEMGVPDTWLPRLALAKAAGAAGLLIGLVVPVIGIAAAIGVALYFVGAVVAHVRAHDYAIAPAVVLGLAAVAAVVLRIATA
ncbi:DoxX family protein [Rhodococcus maanshanensis]|uniref:DoxX-like family protein n=1 Tax=Rhodococcus maanshanensis TaxID=183556 RepID=A0A1H7JMC4_9NOCA|nr:DoxX family protein [Rhodococcus maanshanensis]SEK74615.1 DoxX-like family protein [Rhodococcus maanshanensis]